MMNRLTERLTWRRISLVLGGLLLLAGLLLPSGPETRRPASGLGLILLLVGAGALFAWLQKRKAIGKERRSCLLVRDRMKLSGNKSLHLLRVDGRTLLIACSAERIDLLARWSVADETRQDEGEPI